jgi:acyl-CoA thioester hydrolase
MLENFIYSVPIEVRFADLDVLGHLNNAKYSTYIEQARITYVRDVCNWNGNWLHLGMILARTEIDYKLPIEFGEPVRVYVRVSRLGNKSFDFEYAIVKNEDELAAMAKTVIVAYDYEKGESIAVPQQWREAITAYEKELA